MRVAPGGEHSYRDRENLQVLLVLQVLIRGHEYVKPVGRPAQQLAILQRGPAHLLDAANCVLG